MSLHGLLSVTIGVPNVEETAAYYAEFGLAPEADGWFSTLDAGRQLRLVSASTRRLIDLRVGLDVAPRTRQDPVPACSPGGPRRRPRSCTRKTWPP